MMGEAEIHGRTFVRVDGRADSRHPRVIEKEKKVRRMKGAARHNTTSRRLRYKGWL